MTFEQAVEQLSFHCGSNPNINDPRWEAGFLQTLRPYRGLRKDVYENLLQCLATVEEHLKRSPQLDRRIWDRSSTGIWSARSARSQSVI